MFTLPNMTKVKLVDANPRSELHGKDLVPAIDLKFSMDCANDALSEFDGFLLHLLYKKAEGAESEPAQGQLDGVAPVSNLPNLRFPKLKMPLGWDAEATGYELVIDHGMGGRSNLVLGGCKIDGFKFDCKEGGTVTISWRLQASKIADKEMGKLCALIQHDLDITLVGPEAEQQGITDDPRRPETSSDDEDYGDEEPKSATDQFIDQHAGKSSLQ